MTTFHLKLEEAEIGRFAAIGGDADNPHTGKILISGYIRDLLGYDFIVEPASSSEYASHLEVSIHVTEDENRLKQPASLFIYDDVLSVVTYVNYDYFNYILTFMSDSSLRVSLRMDVVLSEEEVSETFWGLLKTRELGFKNVKIDESIKDFEIIKSGIEIDSKCARILPTLIIRSLKTATEKPLEPRPIAVKQGVLSDTQLSNKPANSKNILIVIAFLLLFILLKI